MYWRAGRRNHTRISEEYCYVWDCQNRGNCGSADCSLYALYQVDDVFSVNWLTLLLLVLAFVLARLALNGHYADAWQAITNLPLTPAQAQAQSQASANTAKTAALNRIG